MVEIITDFVHLLLEIPDFLVNDLGVELGNLADRLLHELEDVFHCDFPLEKSLVLKHLGEDVLNLGIPGLLVLFQDFINPVLKENLLERGVVPAVLELVQPDLELFSKEFPGMIGIVGEDVVHTEELRLVVLDYAGVRGNGGLAVGECVECVDCLVRGNVVRQVYDYLRVPVRGNVIWKMNHEVGRVGRHILDFLYFDFSLSLGLENGLDERMGGLTVRYFLDSQCVLVDLLYFGAHLHDAAPLALHIFGAVRHASGREVRQKLERLSPETGYGSVNELIEIVRKNLGCHTYGNALCSLSQQERESYRQFDRFLVPSVVGCHPAGHLRVEDYLLRKLAESGLNISGSGVGVTCENVTPVSLTIHGKAFLPELYEGSEDGLVTVRMVLHSLADNVRHLGETAVVHLVHRMEDPSLHGLETVHYIRNGPLEDDV